MKPQKDPIVTHQSRTSAKMHTVTYIVIISKLLLCSAYWYHEIHQNMTEFDNLDPQPTVEKRKITLGYYRYFKTQNEIRCGRSINVPVDVYKVRAYQLLRFRNGTTVERLIGTSRLANDSSTEIASHTVQIQGRMLISFDDEFVEIPSDLYIGFSKLCACNEMLEMIHGRIRIPMKYTFKNEQLASENVFIKEDDRGCA